MEKVNEITIVQTIKEWSSKGPNHCPGDAETSRFVREIIPYLEQLENRIKALESKENPNDIVYGAPAQEGPIKCITFDKQAQDNLPQHIKDKMKADRENTRKNY